MTPGFRELDDKIEDLLRRLDAFEIKLGDTQQPRGGPAELGSRGEMDTGVTNTFRIQRPGWSRAREKGNLT